MYIQGFGGGWKPAGHMSQNHANKHGWRETGLNSCGDPIVYSRGHIFEYLSYTYDAGHTHESCIVKRKIRGQGWKPSNSLTGRFSLFWTIVVGIVILIILAFVLGK